MAAYRRAEDDRHEGGAEEVAARPHRHGDVEGLEREDAGGEHGQERHFFVVHLSSEPAERESDEDQGNQPVHGCLSDRDEGVRDVHDLTRVLLLRSFVTSLR